MAFRRNPSLTHSPMRASKLSARARAKIGSASPPRARGRVDSARGGPVSPGAENASVRPHCISLAPCRSFPTSVGVARERGETDSLSRTLTAVYVRPLVREPRASHAATSPPAIGVPAVGGAARSTGGRAGGAF